MGHEHRVVIQKRSRYAQIVENPHFRFLEDATHERQGVLIADKVESLERDTTTVQRTEQRTGGLPFHLVIITHHVKHDREGRRNAVSTPCEMVSLPALAY